jgi:hypothetical protein
MCILTTDIREHFEISPIAGEGPLRLCVRGMVLAVLDPQG